MTFATTVLAALAPTRQLGFINSRPSIALTADNANHRSCRYRVILFLDLQGQGLDEGSLPVLACLRFCAIASGRTE